MPPATDVEQDFTGAEPLADEEYFSETYWEAREKFRRAAAAAGAELVAPLLVKEPDYTIDVAVLPGTSPRGLLLHSSGTHGPEGFAGSAIQTALLHEVRCSQQRPPVTCVFIHAVNPVGMAHFRRWNENNVDLNRNAMVPEEWQEVLARDPNIAGYEDLRENLVPNRAPSFCYRYFTVWFHLISAILTHGFRHAKRALVSGTYNNPTGLFFGGRELQPSHRLVRDFLQQRFGPQPAESLSVLDVHTGLGPQGVDVLMPDHPFAADVLRAANITGADIQCSGDPNAQDGTQAAGYDLTRGLTSKFYARILGDSGKALPIVQEFGTIPPVPLLRCLLIENMGYHFDRANHERRWAPYTRDGFYVRKPQWKRNVLARGKAFFHQLAALTRQRAAGPGS